MTIFKVHFYAYEIGGADFLHSFFSTVACRLEGGAWGSRYPSIMNSLYQGELAPEAVPSALCELAEIQKKLKGFPPKDVVWDIDDLSKQPPWKDNISGNITDLSDYFITSDGEDFITLFFRALKKAEELGEPLKIETL